MDCVQKKPVNSFPCVGLNEQFPLFSLAFSCLVPCFHAFPSLPFPSLICSSLMFGWLVGRVGGWVRCLVGLVG